MNNATHRAKKSKKCRKHGTGIEKLAHSKWGSYAALMKHQQVRRIATMERRFCLECETQFHSRGALKRHVCG